MSTIVGVFAHPDDEAFGPGGTLAKMASEGHEVHIICSTDGDHQDKGLKNVRNSELLKSAEILGAKKVHFLDFVDGSLSNNLYHELEKKIEIILNDLQPETIVTFHPNGVSGHIDHMVVTSVINHLFPKLDYLKKIMYFAMRDSERKEVDDYFVHMPEGLSKSNADLVVDIEDQWPTVVRAMQAHVSQKKDCEWMLSIFEKLPKEEYFIVRSK